MVARLDSAPAAAAIPVRFRETARELLSETWAAARAIDNAWHTTFAELESCRAELVTQSLRSHQEQLRLDQLRAQLTAEHLQEAQDREHEVAALRTTVVELQEQRTILEMELDHARQQAAQLTAELAELRQLRLAVERPWSSVPVAHEHSPAVVLPVLPAEFAPAVPEPAEIAASVIETVTPAIDTAAAAAPPPEPGLGSVLNHFQNLQKDLARRRAQPKGTKPTA